MTAGCARCGDCCERIYLSTDLNIAKWTTAALTGVPDPASDEGWAYWLEHGWQDDQRDNAIRRFRPDGTVRADADFIAAHWTPAEDERWSCDAFDPDSRTCTAHESRPSVCRDYPWYGRDPTADDGTALSNLRCSYLADLPPEKRPPGARPLIPLTPV